MDKEKVITAKIQQMRRYGFCRVAGVTIYESSVINRMLGDEHIEFVLSRLVNGLPEFATELNNALYDNHARDLIIDALASVED